MCQIFVHHFIASIPVTQSVVWLQCGDATVTQNPPHSLGGKLRSDAEDKNELFEIYPEPVLSYLLMILQLGLISLNLGVFVL